jgi:hypothetical protein
MEKVQKNSVNSVQSEFTLCCDAISVSGYIASNGRMIGE